MIEIKQFDSITKVPDEWDTIIGDNLYLSKDFLAFMEGIDKCDQKYYKIQSRNVHKIQPSPKNDYDIRALVGNQTRNCI